MTDLVYVQPFGSKDFGHPRSVRRIVSDPQLAINSGSLDARLGECVLCGAEVRDAHDERSDACGGQDVTDRAGGHTPAGIDDGNRSQVFSTSSSR